MWVFFPPVVSDDFFQTGKEMLTGLAEVQRKQSSLPSSSLLLPVFLSVFPSKKLNLWPVSSGKLARINYMFCMVTGSCPQQD